MGARLHPCASCARHVLVGSSTCPFCAAALPDIVPVTLPTPTGRAGRAFRRAALLVAGAAAGTACDEGASTLFYGCPQIEDCPPNPPDNTPIFGRDDAAREPPDVTVADAEAEDAPTDGAGDALDADGGER
jgi:hypothetical protein